jgi:hypothetical protein
MIIADGIRATIYTGPRRHLSMNSAGALGGSFNLFGGMQNKRLSPRLGEIDSDDTQTKTPLLRRAGFYF